MVDIQIYKLYISGIIYTIDLKKSKNEQCVQDLVTCMHEFDSFPFDQSSLNLCTLQSAMPASDELHADFKSAHNVGEDKLISFLQEQVFSKNTFIHTPVPLNKRLKFCENASRGRN